MRRDTNGGYHQEYKDPLVSIDGSREPLIQEFPEQPPEKMMKWTADISLSPTLRRSVVPACTSCLFLMLDFDAEFPHSVFVCLVMKFFDVIVLTFCVVALFLVLSPST